MANTSEGECAAPTPHVDEEGIETRNLKGLLGELKVNLFPQFRSHIHFGGRAYYAHDVQGHINSGAQVFAAQEVEHGLMQEVSAQQPSICKQLT